MRFTLAILGLLLAGCRPADAPPQPRAPEPAARSEAREAPQVHVRADWLEQRLLPAQTAGVFEGRYVYAPPRRAVSLAKLEEAQPAPAPVVIPPPPFKYVGKVERGRDEGYAVLAGESKMFMVRAGDTLDGGYGVQSVSEARVVVVNLASGVAHALAYASDIASRASVPATVLAAPRPSSPEDDPASDGGGSD